VAFSDDVTTQVGAGPLRAALAMRDDWTTGSLPVADVLRMPDVAT